MCGLAGTAGPGAGEDAVGNMLDRIAHRGPDGRGVRDAGGAVHGHVRLALVDLTGASAQPFRLGDTTLSFNGEVWNHAELRAELRALGRSFRTTGDTEVLAAAIDEWGLEGALPRVDGMFAIAWSGGGRHALARDRYGKVPLYAVRGPGGAWSWASERKAWEVPESAAAAPVPPGTILDLGTARAAPWYRLPPTSPHGPEDLPGLMRESVRRRLSADAPVCVLSSGGLDSTIVLALAREARPDVVAYTAVHDPGSPDLAAARRACAELEVPLREVPVGRVDARAAEEAIRAIEVPTKAQVEIAVLCVPLAARIAADGFKACLTGEGADELFGGYGNMAIRASAGGDDLWRRTREEQLAKMARGNFVRCNKAFMARSVEARLPFLSREVVELALSLGKDACPPGKGLLKSAFRGMVPGWIVKRQKDTFQGASGTARDLARQIASPTRFYNAEARRLFGAAPAA